MNHLGQHLLVEYYGCSSDQLKSPPFIEAIMLEAARRSKATIVSSHFHHFNPHGVSGVIVIAESHLTIHTWPEHRYAAVDLFTCGKRLEPQLAFEYLSEALQARDVGFKELKRGDLSKINP
jgi:S-adenosylmethionine decarboxylase proenzyme